MKKVMLILAGLSVLAGCGGGNSAPGTNTNFTGATTQATMTASNAKALSFDAYAGRHISSGINVVAKEAAGTNGSRADLSELSSVLEYSIRTSVNPSIKISAQSSAATAQATVPGYSGAYSYVVNVDHASGAFNGTMTYTQYKELSWWPVIEGSISYSGVMNTATGSIITTNITFSSLAVTSSTRSYTLSGNMTMGNSGITTSLTQSIVLKDKATGKTYWFKDYTLQQTGTALQMTGTYYDHDHGYVDISTVTQLTAATTDALPSTGQLLFTGKNGTKARLTFGSLYPGADAGSLDGYYVEVDANGIGSFVVVP